MSETRTFRVRHLDVPNGEGGLPNGIGLLPGYDKAVWRAKIVKSPYTGEDEWLVTVTYTKSELPETEFDPNKVEIRLQSDAAEYEKILDQSALEGEFDKVCQNLGIPKRIFHVEFTPEQLEAIRKWKDDLVEHGRTYSEVLGKEFEKIFRANFPQLFEEVKPDVIVEEKGNSALPPEHC